METKSTNKQWINGLIVIGAFLFSLLFYQQGFGLNVLLFSILNICILFLNKPTTFREEKTILISIAYLISGVSTFLYDSSLSIICNVIAFFTLIGCVSNSKSSIYIQWFNGIYTSSVAIFSLYFENLYDETKNIKKKKINYTYWIKIIGIPLIVSSIFIKLYRNGNPKFDALIAEIDFSFINFGWIVFTSLGYYLLYNITHPVTAEPITSLDIKTNNSLEQNASKSKNDDNIKGEIQLGLVLLISLNVLIVLFLLTDINYLLELHEMSAPQLSQQVHTGVNAIIASNLLAIAIILYFFRGDINFTNKNKHLKQLTFGWIFLNLTMLIITAIKNLEYIISFGLTYKRIGVLCFLLVTAIGLITTFIKVTKVKNLWFLLRKNVQIAFIILMVSSLLNWDKIITNYNINYAEQLDINYLINLSNNNTFLLKEYSEKNKIIYSHRLQISKKYDTYVTLLKNNSWQEKVFDNYTIK